MPLPTAPFPVHVPPCAQVDAAECNGNLADCTEKQLKTLDDWVTKFNSKYTVVGKVATEAAAAAEAQ
jgi:hypothetical protein